MAFGKRMIAVALMTAAGIAALIAPAGIYPALAAPEPSVVPVSWELTFKSQPPERLIMAPTGQKEKQTYWFIRYTVTNNAGRDVVFTPQFDLMTETGQVLTAGKNIDYSIFTKIKALYKNAFLEDPFQILGRLLQGEDNAKDGVAIFTGADTTARTFRIAISGLSGETAEVENPLTHEKVILHKTLILEYDLPGQAIGIDPQPQFKSKTWVMK